MNQPMAIKTGETTDHKLTRLTEAWKFAKQQEAAFNESRIQIESQIYELTQSALPEKGTYTTLDGMKITTGFSEDWDQSALQSAYAAWDALVPFPFTGVWKPDGKAIAYLRENAPKLYRVIQPALTLKPKKPSFSLPADK